MYREGTGYFGGSNGARLRRGSAAMLLAAVVAAAVRVASQTTVGMPQATGDQLLFFYDARDRRAPFLMVANPSDEAVTIEVVFYGRDLQELDREDRILAAAGNVVIDPTSTEYEDVRGSAGIAVITPIGGPVARQPVVPPAPLAGSYTLANTALRNAFGSTALGRRAVDAEGVPAEPGSTVDGVAVRYQRLRRTD